MWGLSEEENGSGSSVSTLLSDFSERRSASEICKLDPANYVGLGCSKLELAKISRLDWLELSKLELPELLINFQRRRLCIASGDLGPRRRSLGPGFDASPSVLFGPGGKYASALSEILGGESLST